MEESAVQGSGGSVESSDGKSGFRRANAAAAVEAHGIMDII